MENQYLESRDMIFLTCRSIRGVRACVQGLRGVFLLYGNLFYAAKGHEGLIPLLSLAGKLQLLCLNSFAQLAIS